MAMYDGPVLVKRPDLKKFQFRVNDAVFHDGLVKRVEYVDTDGVPYVKKRSYTLIEEATGCKLVGRFVKGWFGYRFVPLEEIDKFKNAYEKALFDYWKK